MPIIKAIFNQPKLNNMRSPVIILCLLFVLSACNDSKKSKESDESATQDELIDSERETESFTPNSSPNKITSDNEEDENSNRIDSAKNRKTTTNSIAGLYIKSDRSEDINCNCYCLDLKFNEASELCLSEDELYINGRFEKKDENILLYYAGKAAKNSNTDIPWDEFETGTPIAVLTPTGNGFNLDWKGFSINGKIAIDYALFGKKTLEGTYKKK